MSADPVRVVFVCWGNICRSPMAERVAEKMAADEGLTGVEFTSAATSREELGAPIDRRAETVLREHGNMSSATILFILARMLDEPADADAARVAALAFGPGLTVESAMLTLRGGAGAEGAASVGARGAAAVGAGVGARGAAAVAAGTAAESRR